MKALFFTIQLLFVISYYTFTGYVLYTVPEDIIQDTRPLYVIGIVAYTSSILIIVFYIYRKLSTHETKS